MTLSCYCKQVTDMTTPGMTVGLENEIIDAAAYQRNIDKLREAGVQLPRIRDPLIRISTCGASATDGRCGPGCAGCSQPFRVHWYNDEARRGLTDVPEHIVLPEALTGISAKVVVALGNRFPMISTHKVLAAYGCLIPRLLSGAFDASRHRAWPSTGNYCRGGVAIATPLGCRSVAVLPEGMSQERFDWLNRWLADPNDIYGRRGQKAMSKRSMTRAISSPRILKRHPESVQRVRELHHSPCCDWSCVTARV